ncbi:MAG: response regulator [Thermoguttaceae bacterium]|jgi:CheY-like chemotaxis protein
MFASVMESPKTAPAKITAGRRPSILIIDDDEVLSDVLSRRLQQQGFDALTADSGQCGLARARADQPSLILLDLRLPDADGITICEQLADDLETCAIPVIILTGMERPDILRRCRAAGCHYYLRKPYDPNALLVLISQAIADTHGSDDYGT